MTIGGIMKIEKLPMQDIKEHMRWAVLYYKNSKDKQVTFAYIDRFKKDACLFTTDVDERILYYNKEEAIKHKEAILLIRPNLKSKIRVKEIIFYEGWHYEYAWSGEFRAFRLFNIDKRKFLTLKQFFNISKANYQNYIKNYNNGAKETNKLLLNLEKLINNTKFDNDLDKLLK